LHYLILYTALLLLLLLLSLFFSGAETAYTAVNRLRLKYLTESGDKKAEIIKRIVSNPDRLLGVLLLGNTISNIAAASLVTYLVAEYFPARAEQISVVATILLTIVVLIFCELTPKIISAAHAEAVSRKILLPIRFVLWILGPFARLASWLANRLVRLTRLAPSSSPFVHALSEDEIRAIIAGSSADGLADEKREMLHNIFEITATEVRAIMIPRVDVTTINIDDPMADTLAKIRQTHYSRFPVYRGSFDNILGILNVKDLLPYLQRPSEINLEVLLRPAPYLPDTARIDAALRQLQSMHQHMAIVVDEFGGVDGIVTMEDLIEEIVGEIRDEHDTETESVHPLGPDLYSIAGSLPVKDFNRFFEHKIPESKEYATVVGFLQTRTGRLLQEGEMVRYQELTFSIEKVDGFRTVSIRVRVPIQSSQSIN
jgi:putative hemolysin